MHARYDFRSEWDLPAAPVRCWELLERLPRERWWPGVDVAAPEGWHPGARVTLRVRSPLGYALRVRAVLDEVRTPERLSARADGDLRGHGALALHPHGGGTRIVVHWHVVTTKRWMNAFALLLRPLFEAAHRRVMHRGERAMRAALVGGR